MAHVRLQKAKFIRYSPHKQRPIAQMRTSNWGRRRWESPNRWRNDQKDKALASGLKKIFKMKAAFILPVKFLLTQRVQRTCAGALRLQTRVKKMRWATRRKPHGAHTRAQTCTHGYRRTWKDRTNQTADRDIAQGCTAPTSNIHPHLEALSSSPRDQREVTKMEGRTTARKRETQD